MPEAFSHLARRWIHSHEEDEGDLMVFRPAGYEFPLSRARREFDLKPDGTLVEGGPAPDDRIARTSGSWELTGNELTLSGRGEPRRYRIESSEPDRLVLRQA